MAESYNPAERPGTRKEVVYFLAKYTDAKPCVVRQNEVRTLKSLRLEEAIDIIEHDNKKELLKQADAYIKKNYI